MPYTTLTQVYEQTQLIRTQYKLNLITEQAHDEALKPLYKEMMRLKHNEKATQ